MTPPATLEAVEVETWRAIPGFEGSYEVSDLGNVRSLDREIVSKRGQRYVARGRLIQPGFRGYVQGYKYVALWRNKKRTTMYVHRAVLLAFVGPPPEPGQEASHEPDPDPNNCRLDNLRWRAHRANCVERDMRASGASYVDIQVLLDRTNTEPGYDDAESVEAEWGYDPVLTGETPF